MHQNIETHTQAVYLSIPKNVLLAAAFCLLGGVMHSQVAPPAQPSAGNPRHAAGTQSHRSPRRPVETQAVEQAPPPRPMPHWPVNDTPNPPSVVWDASGLRINASNSSLQQILNEVSTDTGTKVVGNVPDQRVFGSYGPGQASDVLLQLLQGSGFNVLLAGDLGHGAPSQIVLTPRHGGGSSGGVNQQQPQAQQQDPDDGETVDQQEPQEQPEETVPAIPPPAAPAGQAQPGTPPNGPMRTPQEIMQEMQQRQLLQQQQMQQQMQQQQQQGNPTAPQQQENPE